MRAIIALAFILSLSLFAYTSADAQTVTRKAVLTWTAPTACSDGAALTNCPILGYSIQKLSGTTWTQIGVTTSNVLTYTDNNLPLGTHTYRVLATSEAGPSAPSNQVTKTLGVPGAPGNVVVTVTVTIS